MPSIYKVNNSHTKNRNSQCVPCSPVGIEAVAPPPGLASPNGVMACDDPGGL